MIQEYRNKMMETGKNLRRRFAIRILRYGIKNYPDHFNAMVQETSVRATRMFIDQEMEKRGLVHCQCCNERFGLKKNNGVYLCIEHFKILSKTENKESVKLEAV